MQEKSGEGGKKHIVADSFCRYGMGLSRKAGAFGSLVHRGGGRKDVGARVFKYVQWIDNGAGDSFP